MRDSRLRSHIGESSIAIIAKEMRRRFSAGREAFEPRAVHHKNVEPSIVVEIVESNAAARGLEQILVLVLAAENSFRIQPGFPSDVDEVHSRIGTLLGRFC